MSFSNSNFLSLQWIKLAINYLVLLIIVTDNSTCMLLGAHQEGKLSCVIWLWQITLIDFSTRDTVHTYMPVNTHVHTEPVSESDTALRTSCCLVTLGLGLSDWLWWEILSFVGDVYVFIVDRRQRVQFNLFFLSWKEIIEMIWFPN